MSSKIICNVLLFVGVFGLSIGQETGLQACQKEDPSLNDCLFSQAEKVVKVLKNGLPQYDLPPLDPFYIDSITGSGDADIFRIKLTMTNISVTGHSTMKFIKVKFDPNTLKGEIAFHMPVLGCICEYYAIGRMFSIPLESNAYFNGEFGDVNYSIKFSLKIVERKGVQFYTVDKLSVKAKVATMHILDLISLNPATQTQVNIIKEFTNANDKLLLQLINPIVNSNIALLYKHMFETYLRHVPVNNLLL